MDAVVTIVALWLILGGSCGVVIVLLFLLALLFIVIQERLTKGPDHRQ